MKLFRTALSLLLVFALLAALPAGAAKRSVYTGYCGARGNNLYWTLDTELGLLTVEGRGEMQDYAFGEAPWYELRSYIKAVRLYKNVTTIGSYAFAGSFALVSVCLPESLTSIGTGAFHFCERLTSVTIPEGTQSIGAFAFSDCRALITADIASTVTSLGDHAFYGCTSLTSAVFHGAAPAVNGSLVFGSCAPSFRVYYDSAFASSWAPGGASLWQGYPVSAGAPAEDHVTVSAAVVEGTPGATVSVAVDISGAAYSANTLFMHILYDADYLTVSSVERGPVWLALPEDDLTVDDYSTRPGDVSLGIICPTAALTQHGTLVTVCFEFAAGCTKDQPVLVVIDEFASSPLGGASVPVNAAALNGAVNVKYCTVTFYDPIGDNIIEVQRVISGSEVETPEVPMYPGYRFVGWDTDCSCVTEDLFVTAIYVSTGLAGDVNGDGQISFTDVSVLYGYLLGLNSLSPELAANADVDGDGAVTFNDVGALYFFCLGGN